MENRILKELGNAAVETIEKMDEEIEYKDNKMYWNKNKKR
jgi:hypothetical protein